MNKKPLELLAPAGSAQIGKAAIDHGADAVYIGAPRFSARAQAGNTIADIAGLVEHAHLFHARVYVALNTILTDDEIHQALELIRSLYEVGIDGLIIQDMGLLELDLPPLPLIASTQTHNASPEKIKFLEAVGFQRVILARELSLAEIKAIHSETTTIALEAFVHGALCVSYSGQCYMSQITAGRSGNRGVCAQPCRHSYSLVDGNGNVVIKDKHLISIKDMNRIDHLAELAEAGVTSFKIEGRYKEIDYVKNVTAAYRLALDRLIAANQQYRKAAGGACTFSFQPNPATSFNRGFTAYFLSGNREKIAAMDSPKSIGESIGSIESIGRNFFRIHHHDLQNGDGLCFFTKDHRLTGCRVNRVDGDKIFPGSMEGLTAGTLIYRNFDKSFARTLEQSSNCRMIDIDVSFHQEPECIRLIIRDEDGITVEEIKKTDFEPARNPLRARANIETQLSRTGGTPYRVRNLTMHPEKTGFLALSILNDIRRKSLSKLSKARTEQYLREEKSIQPNNAPYPEKDLDYQANVLNSHARQFYARHGATVSEQALESTPSLNRNEAVGKVLMTTRYCLRYELDACLESKQTDRKTLKPPLTISDNQNLFQLEFDCRNCCMKIRMSNRKPQP